MISDVSFVSKVSDVPAFEELMTDFYNVVLKTFEAAGGPVLTPQDLARRTIENLDKLLPPDGRLALARNQDGRLVGCGAMRRIRSDAAEMKHMFVRPEAQGQGLGRQLFEMRVAEARNMGCRTIYVDTAKDNRSMLSMYEKYGFQYIPRYPENANSPEFEPYLVFMKYDL